jgi:hypothetical protein
MEQRWNDSDRGKPKYWQSKTCIFATFYHNFYMFWAGIESGPPRLEAGDWPPEPRHGLVGLTSWFNIHLLLFLLIFGLILCFIYKSILELLKRVSKAKVCREQIELGHIVLSYLCTFYVFIHKNVSSCSKELVVSLTLKGNNINWVYSKNKPSYSTFSVPECFVVASVITPLYL